FFIVKYRFIRFFLPILPCFKFAVIETGQIWTRIDRGDFYIELLQFLAQWFRKGFECMFGPAVGAGKRICHKTGNRGYENNSAFPSLYHPFHKSLCQKNRSKGVHLKLMTEIFLRYVSKRTAFFYRCVIDQYIDTPLPCLFPVFGIS